MQTNSHPHNHYLYFPHSNFIIPLQNNLDLGTTLNPSSIMRFIIALAALLSGASSSSTDNTDYFEDGLAASLSSSRNLPKEGQSPIHYSSNDYKNKENPTLRSIDHLLRSSRESSNSLIDENQYDDNDKALMLDGTSTVDSRKLVKNKGKPLLGSTSTAGLTKFEVCEDLGVMKSCSSKEDICVPLTEHQLSILSDETEMDTYLTEEEKREMSICLDVSSIEVLNLLTTDGDASAAVVPDGKGTILEQHADAVPNNGEEGSHRYLQSTDCTTYCAISGNRPVITQSGDAFKELS